ncbi:MAG: hypothetical protein Kow0076_0340 [Francisella sp.]
MSTGDDSISIKSPSILYLALQPEDKCKSEAFFCTQRVKNFLIIFTNNIKLLIIRTLPLLENKKNRKLNKFYKFYYLNKFLKKFANLAKGQDVSEESVFAQPLIFD